MNHSQSLPEPSTDALCHSQKLVNVIRKEIENSNAKAITFRRYMEMALYQPNLGYYVAGTYKIGKGGDFTTAPEISSLFSKCIAKQCAQILQKKVTSKENSNRACVLELGAGSGRMACDIMLELEQLKQLPKRYYILDLSPDLIKRQQQSLKKSIPHLYKLFEWIDKLPENFNGVIIGNEVLDAMPVNVFTQNGDDVYEHHIIWSDKSESLVEQLRPANEQLKQKVLKLNIQSETPYTSEINPNLNGWFKTLNKSLQSGLVLLIDYGYTHGEYYLPERNKGTLICHYQHLVNDAPLKYPGLQDITANVDFTAVAEASNKTGFTIAGFTSQAHFLTNSGLEEYFIQALKEQPDDDKPHQYHLAQQVRTLSLPTEMGERFKCIALIKNNDKHADEIIDGTDWNLLGFKQYDQRFRL